MTREKNMEIDNLDIVNIIFNRFLEKLIKNKEIAFTDESMIEDLEKINSELIKGEGEYQEYINDSLMYFGYRLREDNRINSQVFQSQLEAEYGYIYYHLELIYLMSIELGLFVYEKSNLGKSQLSNLSNLIKIQHIRACSIYAEITHLIKGGFGTGAMTRYRSLHELAVTLEFIYKHGEKAADSYLDYTNVMKAKDAVFLKYLYGENENINQSLSMFEKLKPSLKKKYGERLVDIGSHNDYEWAKPFLGRCRYPSFGKIRGNINRQKGREQYKLSSNNIHSAPKSIISSLGSNNGYPVIGASNIGLAEPGGWAVYELVQINVLLMKLILDYDKSSIIERLQTLFIMRLIQDLANHIYKEFRNMEKKLMLD